MHCHQLRRMSEHRHFTLVHVTILWILKYATIKAERSFSPILLSLADWKLILPQRYSISNLKGKPNNRGVVDLLSLNYKIYGNSPKFPSECFQKCLKSFFLSFFLFAFFFLITNNFKIRLPEVTFLGKFYKFMFWK